MTDVNFTPGPWSVTTDDGDGLEAKFYIQDERGNEIASIEVFSAEEDDNGDWQPDALYGANAALIAAAPDLYEALAPVLRGASEADYYCPDDVADDHTVLVSFTIAELRAARAAIAKVPLKAHDGEDA